ncbi:MAG: histone deacetylase [Leptolyngbya sp. SIO4C1]|nr:histone deacetylase [Leptolyngbya sp. SIO4C1]
MTATIAVLYDDAFLQHDTGVGHPENAGRLTAVQRHLRSAAWSDSLQWQTPTPIDRRSPLPWVEAVHAPQYVSALKAFAERGGGYLDGDTVVSPQSYAIALLAVNAWLDAVDWVRQQPSPAFVLARPPGHHAMRDRGMGFCLFSNAAIAAHYALAQPDIGRVAILDWDVHHGNGTQALVEANPQIAYCSLHQSPAYPGTGQSSEHGLHQNVRNIPMPAGSQLKDYAAAFEHEVVPFIQAVRPDLLMVSAGYDATAADPLASIALQPDDYGVLTQHCRSLAPRLLFGLEGGYDYEALAQSVAATLTACL